MPPFPAGWLGCHSGPAFAATDPADERLLIVNLGPDFKAPALAEPLVAPPGGYDWRLHWSSEHPDYGGGGTPPPVTGDGWLVLGHSAVVLAPAEAS